MTRARQPSACILAVGTLLLLGVSASDAAAELRPLGVNSYGRQARTADFPSKQRREARGVQYASYEEDVNDDPSPEHAPLPERIRRLDNDGFKATPDPFGRGGTSVTNDHFEEHVFPRHASIPNGSWVGRSPYDAGAFEQYPGILDPDCGACDGYGFECCPTDDCERTWMVRGGALFYTRSNPGRTTLLVDGRTGAEVFDAEQLDFGRTVGAEFAAVHALDNYSEIEVRYMNIGQFSASRDLAYNGLLAVATDPALSCAPDNNQIDVDYDTQLQGAELNFRQPMGNCATAFCGFRWAQLHETLDLDYRLPGCNALAQSQFRTRNNLYGLQIGSRGGRSFGNKFFIGYNAAAGVFYNSAENDSYYVVPIVGGEYRRARDSKGGAAFLQEFGIFGLYHLSDCLALRCGYQLLWLHNTALASEQVPVTRMPNNFGPAGDGIDNDQSVLFHGLETGLVLTW